MDLRREILAEHSKRQAAKIVQWIGDDDKRFGELMHLFLTDVYRVTQRAGWPLGDAVKLHPDFIKPYFPQLLKQIERDDVHIAVKRNVVRLLQFVEIPKRYQGRIFETCYQLLDDPKEPVAVRVFSMTVAANIAKNSPELLEELRLLAMKYPQVMTPGFKARTRHLFGA